MKTIIVNQELEAAVQRMNDAEAAALFRALLLSARQSNKRGAPYGNQNAVKNNSENNSKQIKTIQENEQEKEKYQKNKEEEKEPVVVTRATTEPPTAEWLSLWNQLRNDRSVGDELLNIHHLTREDAGKYLAVWYHFLKANKANKHWAGGYEDFKQNFWHWFRMDCNSPARIQEKFTAIQRDLAAQRRREQQRQQELADRDRQDREWQEHKQRAVPCPSNLRISQFNA